MTRRKAIFWTLVITASLLAIAAFAYRTVDVGKMLPAQVLQPGFYRVVEVYDGDTIGVSMNGQVEKVRMIGVDTPETHKPNTPVQCFGPESSNYTKSLLTGKAVRLEADAISGNRDRYDRLLRYVYTEDNKLVDLELISQGLGFAYLSFPFDKLDQFAATEVTARSNNLGLWAACKPNLKAGRWLSNPL